MADRWITQHPAECTTCGYDISPGEEIGEVNGELNCAGCTDRAEDAGIA